jgi:hypothetical protein
MDQTDTAVSHLMIDYWVAFAATGDPSGELPSGQGAPRPRWPQFGDGNATMHLGPSPSASAAPRAELCRFWDALHPVPYPPTSGSSRLWARAHPASKFGG